MIYSNKKTSYNIGNRCTTPIPEKYYAFLELEQPFDSAYDSTLFVEDEIIDEDGEYKVVQGVYNLDLTIGLYGGYKIDIEKL